MRKINSVDKKWMHEMQVSSARNDRSVVELLKYEGRTDLQYFGRSGDRQSSKQQKKLTEGEAFDKAKQRPLLG
jgi:hypothetical protein